MRCAHRYETWLELAEWDGRRERSLRGKRTLFRRMSIEMMHAIPDPRATSVFVVLLEMQGTSASLLVCIRADGIMKMFILNMITDYR